MKEEEFCRQSSESFMGWPMTYERLGRKEARHKEGERREGAEGRREGEEESHH